MTFEDRVRKALGEMHFANLLLVQQVEMLQQELAQLKTSKQEDKTQSKMDGKGERPSPDV